jgi:hypothetical protein
LHITFDILGMTFPGSSMDPFVPTPETYFWMASFIIRPERSRSTPLGLERTQYFFVHFFCFFIFECFEQDLHNISVTTAIITGILNLPRSATAISNRTSFCLRFNLNSIKKKLKNQLGTLWHVLEVIDVFLFK